MYTSVGPHDFGESQNPRQNCGIGQRKLTEILFLGQRGTFLCGENIPGGSLMRGTARTSLHKHFMFSKKLEKLAKELQNIM